MCFTKRVALMVSLFLAAPGTARADLITDWNAVAYELMRMANVDGAPAARALAIMHISQADAVNTIQNRHTRYAYQGKLQPDASSEAAAASDAMGRAMVAHLVNTAFRTVNEEQHGSSNQ